jgi:hypothetical protein
LPFKETFATVASFRDTSSGSTALPVISFPNSGARPETNPPSVVRWGGGYKEDKREKEERNMEEKREMMETRKEQST